MPSLNYFLFKMNLWFNYCARLVNKKRSVLYGSTRVDLLYGWMMINGLLIAYGLGLITHQSALRTIDVGGILFGSIYLAICLAVSYKLYK